MRLFISQKNNSPLIDMSCHEWQQIQAGEGETIHFSKYLPPSSGDRLCPISHMESRFNTGRSLTMQKYLHGKRAQHIRRW